MSTFRKLCCIFLLFFIIYESLLLFGVQEEMFRVHLYVKKEVHSETKNTREQPNNKFIKVEINLFAYSAFYDNVFDSNRPYIRIIAIDNPQKEWVPGFQCEYYDQNFERIVGTPLTSPARKVNSPDPYNLASLHALTFFLCDLPFSILSPTYVDLLPGNISFEDHRSRSVSRKDFLIKIIYPPKAEASKYRVAACVQPFHSGINKPLGAIEWMEYMKLLCVDHFTFYNYEIGKEMLTVLKSYDENEVSILDWPLPFVDGLRVWGQCVAASDCAHRYRGLADYVIAVDMDEFLVVPSKYQKKNFPEYFDMLWNSYEKEHNAKVKFLKFYSKFSFSNWPSGLWPSDLLNYKKRIVNNLQVPTRISMYPAGQTKFVMRPDRILESGIHWAEVGINEPRDFNVPVEDGFYIHYRECGSYFHEPNQILLDNATCTDTQNIQRDATLAERMGRKLIDRILKKIDSSDELQEIFYSRELEEYVIKYGNGNNFLYNLIIL